VAEIEPVEREVREGDVVVGDLRVSVDGEEVSEEAREAIELEVKEGVLVPELRAVLPGKQLGEVATTVAQMPEDHTNERLRGRTAELQVTIHGVKEKRVPELTDEVAKQLSNGERQTAQELREAVREDLESGARRLDDLAYERKVVQAVVEGSAIDIPRALVQRELDREMEDFEHRLSHQGLRLDRYLAYLDKSEDDFKAEREPEARERIKADLVLDEVGKRLAVSATADEVSAQMRLESEKDADAQQKLDQLLDNRVAREYFEHRLIRLKTLEALVAKAAGEETEGQRLASPAEAE
jgi:trigger factor